MYFENKNNRIGNLGFGIIVSLHLGCIPQERTKGNKGLLLLEEYTIQ